MHAPLPGFASPESTAPQTPSPLTPKKEILSFKRRPLYNGGPLVSPVGFGGYRIGFSKSLGFPECVQALELALEKGVNLIESGATYGQGQSELLIGQTLQKLACLKNEALSREHFVIISKGGVLQGSNIELAKTLQQEGKGFPEITELTSHTWHCIHPKFLYDQVERSCRRLKCETLDGYLLHNPEYMLKKFEQEGFAQKQAQDLFYSKLRESFLALEELVAQNKIRAYGICSNHFGVSSQQEFAALCLGKVHQIARSLPQPHHFKIIQVPLNWIEVSTAFFQREELNNETILTYAQKNDIGVMIHRPFHAMLNDGLIRLTRPQCFSQDELEKLDVGLQKGLQNWTKLAADLEQLAHEELFDAPGYEDAPLSQLVMSTLAHLPGVTSVLCGMRQESYVKDIEEAFWRPSLPQAQKYLRNIYENLEFEY
jgi:aryl-alcohol dehydrogenase-like predicted oxidoreductase